MSLSLNDPNSFANSEDYIIEHIDFDWNVDFQTKTISGSASYSVRNISKNQIDLKLDTKHLDIKEVEVNGKCVTYRLEQSEIDAFGSCLIIPVAITDDKFQLKTVYSTTDKCSALQWLEAGMTCGKKQPYVFSQCQAIHARSLFPCQDTPSVKSTYTARVKAPKEFKVLMSALEDGKSTEEGNFLIHKFRQSINIASYLVAIVCGNLQSKELSHRARVWSEPEMVDRAAEEFVDTEKFLSIAESLCGPYVWGRYDLLVLPPSFPYGGMENPCLTFVTPTLLVGDKSLVFVIAHEITHSWTGNLITNKTWEDFWLNEGHTRYVERLIMEQHYNSEAMRHLLIKIGLAELQESLNNYKEDHPFNQLVPSLKGCDPDDCFSRVPYEKGSNLLFYLETLCGKDKMLRWLKAYFDKYKNKSLTTSEWKEFFLKYMSEKENVPLSTFKKVNWEEWFYGRWKIPVRQNLNEELDVICKTLADKWNNLENIEEHKDELLRIYHNMRPEQKYYFFMILNDFLHAKLEHDKLKIMGELYQLTTTSNSELLFGWSMLCIRTRYETALDQVYAFLDSQGRLKYTKPIYKALFESEEPIKQRTIEHFQRMRCTLHPITEEGVRKLLHLPE